MSKSTQLKFSLSANSQPDHLLKQQW